MSSDDPMIPIIITTPVNKKRFYHSKSNNEVGIYTLKNHRYVYFPLIIIVFSNKELLVY